MMPVPITQAESVWGAPVSSLSVGGTSDRIAIAAANAQAAIRTILELCDPAAVGDSTVGMLSNVQHGNVNLQI
jgi:hypothetical protein